MSSIFISHSSRDATIADAVRRGLAEQGHRSVFLDFDPRDGIPAGRDWEQELYRKIRGCRALVVLCSHHSLASRWCFVEITHARALGKPLFPLRIDDCELDAVLGDRQAIDLTSELAAGLARLHRGLLAAGLDPADAFDWDGSRSPYPGLLAFQEKDAAVFFGRDDEIGDGLDLLNKVRRLGQVPLVMVLGASGSGKSSLVRAGLVPRLRRDAERWLLVGPFRPREDPVRELAGALSRALERAGRPRDWRTLDRELRAAVDRFANVDADSPIARGPDDAPPPTHGNPLLDTALDLRLSLHGEATILLIVDQFEELLGTDAAGFLAFLRASLEAPDTPLLALATMRSDFLGAFQRHPALLDLRYESLSVGPLSTADVTQIIERPARAASVDLESGLVPTLVEDARDTESLPLLAFALRELYERYGGDGQLEVREYREGLGGLQRAVAKAAEDVLRAERLDEHRKEQLRRAFLALARVTDEGAFARRTVRWDSLPKAVHPLLEKLVRARLLVAASDEEGRTLEVAHEALFYSWGRLVRWLDENREALRLRREILLAARSWNEGGRADEDLWRGGRLARARELTESGDLPIEVLGREFVAASTRAEQTEIEAEQERRRRELLRTRRWLAAVSAVAVLAVAATVFALFARRAAERDASRARATAVVVAAETHPDPLVRALLLRELEGQDEPPHGLKTALRATWEAHPMRVFKGHDGPVTTVAFSPSGDRFWTGSRGTMRLWNVDGSGEPSVFAIPADSAFSFTFSPVASRIAIADRSTLRVSHIDGSRKAVLLTEPGDMAHTMAFSPVGDRLATAGLDGAIRVWRADGTGEPCLLEGDPGWISTVVFDPTSTRIATASRDRTARVWSIDSGESVELGGYEGTLGCLAFSPSGELIAGGDLNVAYVWRLDRPAEPIEVMRHGAGCEAIAFSSGGDLLIGGSDGAAYLWRGSERRPIVLRGHEGAVRSVAFSPSGALFVTGSDDRTVRLWQNYPVNPMVLQEHGASVRRVAFRPSDEDVVTVADDGTARLVNRATEHVLLEWSSSISYGLIIAPGADRVAQFVADGTIRVWKIGGAGKPLVLAGLPKIRSVIFGPAGERIAAALEDGTARVWQIDGSGEPLVLEGHGDAFWSVAFDPAGKSIATGSADGTAWIWKTDGSRPPLVLEGHLGPVTSVVFSPAGDRIATASMDHSAQVRRADGSGRAISLEGHEGPVISVTFGPRGDRLLTLSQVDGTARIWQADGTGEALLLESPRGVLFATFDPTGKRVVTVDFDDVANLWSVEGVGDPVALDAPLAGAIMSFAFSPAGDRLVTGHGDGKVRAWQASWKSALAHLRTVTEECLAAEQRVRYLGETAAEALARHLVCEQNRDGAAFKSKR